MHSPRPFLPALLSFIIRHWSFVIFAALPPLHASATTHYVDLNSLNPTPPYTNWPTAATNIQDAVDAAWEGDQVLVTNGVYQSGGRVAYDSLTNRVAVTIPVTVQSVNGPKVTVIQGYQVPGATNGDSAVRCAVLLYGSLVGFTLTNGATRAVNNPGGYGGGVLCYPQTALSNCVIAGCSAFSAGGGSYSFSDIYSHFASFTGCTFASNWSGGSGGGAYSGVFSNCSFIGNSARSGGGAYAGTLSRCLLANNSATGAGFLEGGGGANNGQLNNCLLLGNSASNGGGLFLGSFKNCTIVSNSASIGGGVNLFVLAGPVGITNSIVLFNNAQTSPNYYPTQGLSFWQCCTAPLSSGGGSLTNDPLFIDLAGGNLHLQSNSPCINSGDNKTATDNLDLDGNPRISGGTVDIGAYEFQSPSSILSYAWAQQYRLPTDGSADFSDPDADGMNNWQEWMAGTVPTNSASVLTMYSPSNNAPGLKVSWQSVSGKTYYLLRGTNLGAQPSLSPLQSNLTGQAGTTIYADTTATNPPYFYRVGVQ